MDNQCTTDKMFPPEEGPPPERPLPLQPSIRETFIAHHGAILQQFGDFRSEIIAILDARLAPKPAKSIGETIKTGALSGIRYSAVTLAIAQCASGIARALGRHDIAGPIEILIQALGG